MSQDHLQGVTGEYLILEIVTSHYDWTQTTPHYDFLYRLFLPEYWFMCCLPEVRKLMGSTTTSGRSHRSEARVRQDHWRFFLRSLCKSRKFLLSPVLLELCLLSMVNAGDDAFLKSTIYGQQFYQYVLMSYGGTNPNYVCSRLNLPETVKPMCKKFRKTWLGWGFDRTFYEDKV